MFTLAQSLLRGLICQGCSRAVNQKGCCVHRFCVRLWSCCSRDQPTPAAIKELLFSHQQAGECGNTFGGSVNQRVSNAIESTSFVFCHCCRSNVKRSWSIKHASNAPVTKGVTLQWPAQGRTRGLNCYGRAIFRSRGGLLNHPKINISTFTDINAY